MLVACGGGGDAGKGGQTGDGSGDDAGSVTPVPPDDSWVDVVPDAFFDGFEAEHGGLPMRVDPSLSDSITAWADCLSTVSGCMREAGDDADVGACVASAPVCATDEPWEEGPCCPADCVSAFDAAVSAGSTTHDAYVQVWVMEPACFPGVSE